MVRRSKQHLPLLEQLYDHIHDVFFTGVPALMDPPASSLQLATA